jgi:hypothetical protein
MTVANGSRSTFFRSNAVMLCTVFASAFAIQMYGPAISDLGNVWGVKLIQTQRIRCGIK